MTGGQQAATYGDSGKSFTLTVGRQGTTAFYGWDGASVGALSPLGYGGVNVITVMSGGIYDLFVRLQANVPQDFFKTITVRDSAGVFHTFATAANDGYIPGANTTWQWGFGTAPLWNTTGPQPMTMAPNK